MSFSVLKKKTNVRRSFKNYNKKKEESGIAVIDMNNIKGIVKFENKGLKSVKVTYKITGLSEGLHGFHIHSSGDLTDGCSSACAHFNPTGENHGGPHSKVRHAGDLGNINSKNNLAEGTITVEGISVNSKSNRSIIGRTIIIHQDPDDLGKGQDEESKKTGNAGKRIACAVIGLKQGC